MLNFKDVSYSTMPAATKSGLRRMRRVLTYYVDSAIDNTTGKDQQENAATVRELLAHCERQFAGLRGYTERVKGFGEVR
ncbi:MAG: hypothetical protein WAV20_16590 [Blastocatellia bacterium]